MTTNQQNIENMTALIEALEAAIIAARKSVGIDSTKALRLYQARNACIKAREAARLGQIDACGHHLEAARALIMEARA